MAKFLTTKASIAEIEQIINDANEQLVLISPYIRISESLFQCLKEADNRQVQTVLVYRHKDELKDDVKRQLGQLKHLSVRCLPNLHAKCFFNESAMVITSLNLYDFSEINNREMGIRIDSEHDNEAWQQAIKEARLIANQAEKLESLGALTRETLPRKTPARATAPTKQRKTATTTAKKFVPGLKKTTNKKGGIVQGIGKFIEAVGDAIEDEQKKNKPRPHSAGFCIRCGQFIDQNPDYPLCDKCYGQWARYKNGDFPEKKCHICGKSAKTSYEKPMCWSCFQKY